MKDQRGDVVYTHTRAAVICNSQRVGKGAQVGGILEVGAQILQEAVGHRDQQGQGDIVMGVEWGALGKIHIQGVEGEVQRHLGVEDQNLDPHQGALDQVVLGGKPLDDRDSDKKVDL